MNDMWPPPGGRRRGAAGIPRCGGLKGRNGERMRSSRVLHQIDSLIDDLLNDGELSSSSLASMLMAARDSVHDGYHVALARRIWDANNDLKIRGNVRARYRVDCPVVE
jgi:hypothetical protein